MKKVFFAICIASLFLFISCLSNSDNGCVELKRVGYAETVILSYTDCGSKIVVDDGFNQYHMTFEFVDYLGRNVYGSDDCTAEICGRLGSIKLLTVKGKDGNTKCYCSE